VLRLPSSMLGCVATAAGWLGFGVGVGNGDLKGFHASSGRGGLVTPPNPRSLSADSNRSQQMRRRTSSGRGRGRSSSRGGGDGGEVEPIDRGAESESSTTSTHPPLGRPYTSSLPDDSTARANPEDSADSNPNSLSSKDTGSVHQLETPE